MSTKLVPGSLGAIAAQSGQSLAESFLSATAVIIVDVSGSMAQNDSRGGRTRYEVALEELEKLQKEMPGKIAVIAFSDMPHFVPGGAPIMDGGGTDLAKALEFAKVADVPGMRFVVVSDGCPDDEDKALRVARTYQNRIDTIFVGAEGDHDAQAFLKRLASVGRGQHVTAAQVKELAKETQLLLNGA